MNKIKIIDYRITNDIDNSVMYWGENKYTIKEVQRDLLDWCKENNKNINSYKIEAL